MIQAKLQSVSATGKLDIEVEQRIVRDGSNIGSLSSKSFAC